MVAQGHKPQFDKIIHERTRLTILAYLASNSSPSVVFTELKEKLELSSGNLSIQLKNLEEAGYVEIEKSFVGSKPNTKVRLTVVGSQALSDYLSEMETLIRTLKTE
jgi:DNA-binding MarR family transcriptional regulator